MCGPKGSALGLLIISFTVLSGCSTLWNPYIKPKTDEITYGGASSLYYGTLPDEIDRANSLREQYYDGVADQTKLRNSMALTLIPLSAASLYLGVTSTSGLSRDVITGLGIGGATVYGLGSFFENRFRQRVYLAGSDAVTCAVLAMSPYLVKKSELTVFNSPGDSLSDKELELIMAIHDIQSRIPSNSQVIANLNDLQKNRINYANKLIKEAKGLVSQSENTRATGTDLLGELDSAGHILARQIAKIQSLVNNKVSQSEPTLDDIMTINRGLDRGRLMFTQTEQAGVGDSGSGAQPEALVESTVTLSGFEGSITSLETAIKNLNSKLQQANAIINRVSNAKVATSQISECELADVQPGFTISPNNDLSLKQNGTVSILLNGGDQPYSVAVSGYEDGIEITRPHDVNNKFIIKAKSDAEPGREAIITFSSAGGHNDSQSITITIAQQ